MAVMLLVPPDWPQEHRAPSQACPSLLALWPLAGCCSWGRVGLHSSNSLGEALSIPPPLPRVSEGRPEIGELETESRGGFACQAPPDEFPFVSHHLQGWREGASAGLELGRI